MKKVKKLDCLRVVDNQGEIKYEEYIVRVPQQPNYVQMYIEDLANLSKLSEYALKVFIIIAKNMSYENIIVINKTMKNIIMRESSYKVSAVEKAIKQLVDSGFMERGSCRGEYLVNPYFFAKGRWSDVHKLRLSIEYDPKSNTRTLSSNIRDIVRKPTQEEILEENFKRLVNNG